MLRRRHQIDVHRTFVAGPFGLTIDLDELFRSAATVSIGGRELPVLDRESRFLHACFHAALGDRDAAARRAARRRADDPHHRPRPRRRRSSARRRWRADAVVARAVRLAWSRLGLDAGAVVASGPSAHRPDRFQARALRAYTARVAQLRDAGRGRARRGAGRAGEGRVHARAAARRARAPRRSATGATTAGIHRAWRALRQHAERAMSWTDAADGAARRRPPAATSCARRPKWVQVAHVHPRRGVGDHGRWRCWSPGSFNLLGFVVQLPVLDAAHASRSPGGSRARTATRSMVWFVMAAFSAKMLGALVRYYFTYIAYVSAGDAEEYDAFGKYLAPYYRSLNFSPRRRAGPGHRLPETVTGVLYSVAGSSKLGAFTVFAWLGFIGLLLCWRAFSARSRTATAGATGCSCCSCRRCCTGRPRSGKDAWALFGLGICAYGVARCLTRKPFSGLRDPHRRAVRPWS